MAMPTDLIQIEERMYSATEVARLVHRSPGYVQLLLDRGQLQGVRSRSPSGRPGQWRIYPNSLRKWLGVDAKPARRPSRREVEAEIERYERKRKGDG